MDERSPTYLRVSLTDRCNLRCRYCLPSDARFVPERLEGEALRRLTALVVRAARVEKIRFTGGEPTLVPDLVEHVAHARKLVPVVGLTSNGTLLEPLLPGLQAAGLDRLNISLDALGEPDFQRIARRSGSQAVIGAILAAKRHGFSPLKVNVVAMADTDVVGLVEWATRIGIHLRFIELMRVGEARPEHHRLFIDAATIRERLVWDGIELVEAVERDEPTSRVWTLPGVDPGASSVGFITTVSAPFCSSCNRLRLDAQGILRTCLFQERGYDLAAAWRNGGPTAAETLVRLAVRDKVPPPDFVREGSMAAIGG